MKAMAVSAGLRVVLCTRPECAHAGEKVPGDIYVDLGIMAAAPLYFFCLGDVLVMDRRVAFGLPCARFGLRGPEKPPT